MIAIKCSNLSSRCSLRLYNLKAETSTNTFDIIVIDVALLHQLEESSDVGEGQSHRKSSATALTMQSFQVWG